MALMAAPYFLLALLSIALSLRPQVITDVWFPNAVAIGLLATAPRSRWCAMLVAMAGANFAANVLLRGAPLLSASFLPANLAEVALGAYLLDRTGLARRFSDDGVSFLAALVIGGLVPQLLGATIGASLLHAYKFSSFAVAWPVWFIDSTLGAMALLPLTLALRKPRLVRAWLRFIKPLPLLLGVITVAMVALAFRVLPQPFAFAALPLVAAAILVESLVAFGLAFCLVLTVVIGFDFGWFQRASAVPPWSNLYFYLPLAATVLPAQFLAVVVQRMRRLQADTAALAMIGNDAAAVFNSSGVFRGVNHSYARSFRRQGGSAIGQTIEQGIDPRYAGIVRQRFAQVMASGQSLQARSEIDTADGRRTMDLEYLPLLDDEGQPNGVLLSTHDVTELLAVQRELEANLSQLRAANEGMQQFVRIASHDMREPLNTIVQFCGLIEGGQEGALTPTGRLYFSHVRIGAQRMRTLLDDVLSFVRLDEEVPMRSVALNEVVQGAQEALHSRIVERQARIDVAELPRVIGHESLLALMFQNLLSNGLKFTPLERTPHLQVSAGLSQQPQGPSLQEPNVEGDFVVVTVRDNGIGIAAADQDALFVPFKRLHTRRQYNGTGLGLAICKRVVTVMKGEIWLDSSPGEGTRVHMRLRLAPPLTPTTAQSTLQSPGLTP